MSTIPTSVTQEQFEMYIRPALTTAKRGPVSKIPLFKIFNLVLYHLHTGCQWSQLRVQINAAKRKISWQAVYYHFRKWSRDGSLQRVFERSLDTIRDKINTQHINLDGSHSQAKKGGEAVAYQGRKKAKTSNILPITDANGFVLATTGIVAGNHNDAFELKDTLRAAFKFIKRHGIPLAGSYFNADAPCATAIATLLIGDDRSPAA